MSATQWRLGGALYAWVEAGEGRGICSMPTDVRMDEYNVYGPDLVWIAEEHLPPDLHRYPERVPDLCVEIRSSSTWRYDVGVKKSVYECGGLPELWLVDSVGETVLVFRRSARGVERFDVALELHCCDTLESPQLPGFALLVETFSGASGPQTISESSLRARMFSWMRQCPGPRATGVKTAKYYTFYRTKTAKSHGFLWKDSATIER